MRVALFSILLLSSVVGACSRQGPATRAADDVRSPPAGTVTPGASTDLAYVCPMDRDIRSNTPGTCPRCGMQLVAGVPDLTEYRLDLSVSPQRPRPHEKTRLTFEVFDPWKDNRVDNFSLVHEQLFHAFIISRDLQFFVHDHPTWDHGAFHLDLEFPKPGMYRVLGDFLPAGASPQLIADTFFVSGTETPPAPLTRDYSTKDVENLRVEFSSNPPQPEAGVTSQIRIGLSPADGIQKYLGVWGHMLVASDDLIDMMHTHPFIADGGPEMQFNVVFPRPRLYRVWVQFQRNGIVNTAHFDVPVATPNTNSAP
jgi:Heavy metal binding domain